MTVCCTTVVTAVLLGSDTFSDTRFIRYVARRGDLSPLVYPRIQSEAVTSFCPVSPHLAFPQTCEINLTWDDFFSFSISSANIQKLWVNWQLCHISVSLSWRNGSLCPEVESSHTEAQWFSLILRKNMISRRTITLGPWHLTPPTIST